MQPKKSSLNYQICQQTTCQYKNYKTAFRCPAPLDNFVQLSYMNLYRTACKAKNSFQMNPGQFQDVCLILGCGSRCRQFWGGTQKFWPPDGSRNQGKSSLCQTLSNIARWGNWVLTKIVFTTLMKQADVSLMKQADALLTKQAGRQVADGKASMRRRGEQEMASIHLVHLIHRFTGSIRITGSIGFILFT